VNVVIPAETVPGERRVAALPDVVAQLSAAGLQVSVQAGAGEHALASDEAYAHAGAEVVA